MVTQRPALTLHDAMVQILRCCPDRTAEQVYIAEQVNRQRLYWQENGDPVKSSQIGARAKNYRHLFEKIPANRIRGEMAKIRLR